MVLPQVETMTPGLLAKIRDLVKAGATVVGTPPLKSPSLSGYPACDGEVQALAKDLWGSMDAPQTATKRSYGKGVIHWGGELSPPAPTSNTVRFQRVEWIWYPEGNPAQSAPAGTRYFQRIIHVDETKVLASATAAVSADNEFTLWINGKKVSEGDNFNVTVRTPIASFLRPGDNVIAVAVANSGGRSQSRRMDRRIRPVLQGRIPRGCEDGRQVVCRTGRPARLGAGGDETGRLEGRSWFLALMPWRHGTAAGRANPPAALSIL